MADLFSALPYVVDLDKPVTKTMLYNLFVTTNKKAHRFIITLRRGGADVPFTGSVVGTLINYSDMMTQEYPGRAEDGKVVFDWPDSFYAKSGLFCVIITVDDGEVSNSVFAAEGSMILGETDTLYDPSHVVPSLAELLAQIEATRNAATAANNAATAANNAATFANSAAQSANTIAQTVENKLDAGEFNGEKGDTGATPNITFKVATGQPGTQVQVQQSGTAENPVVSLTIPRGDTGAVDGIDYFEDTPSALGKASPGAASGVARGDHVHPMPTAEQVGARPDNWMPTASQIEDLAAVATSGRYDDLTDTPDIPAEYELPVASAETLGGVKIGNGLTIDADGTVSSAGGSGGGFEMVLLWSNASRESDFAAQKIALDLSSYQTVCIVFDYSAKSYIQGVAFDTVKESSTAQRTCLSMALTNSVARYVTTTTTGCDFGSGMIVMPYGTVVEQNGRAVPLFIYGIR